jgi:hypothetical protein
MIIRRSVPVAVGLVLILGGCSDGGSPEPAGQPTADKPSVTTIDLTLNDQPVELDDAVLKCYDHEGHLMVEAHNADDPEASHFLMDYYKNNVSLSIGVRDGDVFQYEEGTDGQTAEVKRDGASVTITGKIGAAGGSTDPQPFEISASCAEFFDTPPDSSKVDPSDLPNIPGSCPPGQPLCIPEDN